MKQLLSTAIPVVLAIICWALPLMAAPFDTGFISWTQPNGATFSARLWGDEFEWYFETQDGYRLIQGSDAWYYFATLNSNGDYIATAVRVGVDSPPPSSAYKLPRSTACMTIIYQWRAVANQANTESSQWYSQKQAAAGSNPVVLNLGVIFVEFTDIKHYRDTIGTPPGRPFGYYKSDFDSMMFSENYWIGSQGNNKHPEGDPLFGSMRDYFFQMSRGKLILRGSLLNPHDGNGAPRWLTIGNRASYEYPTGLENDAIQSYTDSSNANPGQWPSISGFDKLVFIYAQNDISNLRITHASTDGSYIQVPERGGFHLFGQQNRVYAHGNILPRVWT